MKHDCLCRTSFLKALDARHHQGIRLYLGVFQTSPVDSFYVEANEPPLDLRRLKLTLQYMVKLKANIDNPAFNCVFHPQLEQLFDKNKKYYLNRSILESKSILNKVVAVAAINKAVFSSRPSR